MQLEAEEASLAKWWISFSMVFLGSSSQAAMSTHSQEPVLQACDGIVLFN